MAIDTGFGGAHNNDLIFAFDAGDIYNSYRGEPTTNLMYAGDPDLNSVITWTNSGNWIVSDDDNDVEKPIIPGVDTSSLKIMSGITTEVGSQHFGCAYLTSLSPSTTYTISVWFRQNRAGSNQPYFRTNVNNNSLGNFNYNGSTDTSTWPVNQWIRISCTATLQANENGAYLSNYIGGQVGDKVWYFAHQVEQKPHATRLALGTRSTTASLLDLTGNASLNLNAVSFSQNSVLTFDGSDDQIVIDDYAPALPQGPQITVEAIVKMNAYIPNDVIVAYGGNNDNYGWLFQYEFSQGLMFGIQSSPYGGSAHIGTDASRKYLKKFVHMVGTFSDNELRLYLDGELAATADFAYPIPAASTFRIGNEVGRSYYSNMDLHVARIYSSALTQTQVTQNFNHYRRRFPALESVTDSADGGRWHRFWWYLGYGWPSGETAAFGHQYGTFSQSSPYGFQRLPQGLTKENIELLAKDDDGNIYKWDFGNTGTTALAVWNSMYSGTTGVFANGDAFNPTVIAGSFHGATQDSWQYRVSEGFTSFLLDDDACDCTSTLSAGHAMCGGSGWDQTYAQPAGAYLRYGVDTLNDGGCLGPIPTRRLELFYRIK